MDKATFELLDVKEALKKLALTKPKLTEPLKPTSNLHQPDFWGENAALYEYSAYLALYSRVFKKAADFFYNAYTCYALATHFAKAMWNSKLAWNFYQKLAECYSLYADVCRKIGLQNIEKVYFNSKGLKLAGYLHIPTTVEKNYPVVILCHGATGCKDSRIIESIAKILNENNIAALRIDIRGHGESEGTFSLKGWLEDVNSAILYLNKRIEIDSERIGLLGHSFGGSLGLVSAVKNQAIKAYAGLAPASNLKPIIPFVIASYKLKEFRELKFSDDITPENVEKFVEENNPINIVNKLKKPILLAYGDHDEFLSILKINELFEKANEPKELKVVKDADHVFLNPDKMDECSRFLAEWFKRNLVKA
ncbi:MAG: alpha/beta fold hydrolase [Candidatus Bathyarchaeota archaeon]|nr:alpha/beta fold hydrolase [Candidatus Bathyarchaeota archaeon]